MATIRDHLEARVAVPSSWNTDGSRLLIQSNLPGTMQLFERSMDGSMSQLTDDNEPVSGRYLPATDRIVVQRDQGGSERSQLYFLTASGELEPLMVEPEWIHDAGGASRDGRFLAYRTNRRNGTDFDVFVIDIDSGEERCVYAEGGYAVADAFSPDGSWLAIIKETERSGDNDVLLVHTATGEIVHVNPHDDEASASGPAWLPDSSGFFFATDIGRDVPAIAFYDMTRRSFDYVLETGWECQCAVDWEGHHLLVVTNEEGWTRAELRDPRTLELKGEVPLPGTGVAISWCFSKDGRHLAFHFTSPTLPGDVWSFDTGSTELRRLTASPCSVELSDLAEPTLHRYEAQDGESVPVFLYRRTTAHGSTPVVVVIHGGPESQARPSWNPVIGYLTERGYAVAVPNVRGSTGYGKRYQHLDDRRLRLDSVADLAALHEWLGTQDGIDAARAALYGGSYGGYMVLAGLTFQPDRWAAGVDIVGISSLVTFLQNTSAYRRRVREREYGFLDVDGDFLREASPLTHLDRLRAPLFIIHGANDPRVPLSEAEQLFATLKDKGIRSEFLVYPDEGHGLQKLANRLDAYPKVVGFLDDVLGVVSGG
jgi:dipeptidyl aminopeptidase/acylaminoacyl peptidase